MASTNTNGPSQMSQYIRDKANRTRLAIESYYAQTLQQMNEREQRAEKLEQQMAAEGLGEAEREERRKVHAAKENDFLRQRRTKLSASDFQSLKVWRDAIKDQKFKKWFWIFGAILP